MKEDDFTPWIGRKGLRRSKSSRRYAGQVSIEIKRAGGRQQTRRRRFTGKLLGRGGAVAAVLISRGHSAAFYRRRVVIKARYVRFARRGIGIVRDHLRYIQHDGASREAEPGQLYGADEDRADGREFLQRSKGDRHQFRFMVSPEDAIEYEDLKPLTRRLMVQIEQDLGTRLDWVAADHFDTGHPHTHIVVRGKDESGGNLIISPDYLNQGIRERAAELVSIDLGPRTDREIEERLRREMGAERFTSLDQQLVGMHELDEVVSPAAKTPFRQTLLTGRLRSLERLGLAEELNPGEWRLDQELENTLRTIGKHTEIISTIDREVTRQGLARSAADYVVHDFSPSNGPPIVGRLVAHGHTGERHQGRFLIVDAVDGRTHYIHIGKDDPLVHAAEGSILRLTPGDVAPQQLDRIVVEVAKCSGGHYSIDLHLKHDAFATENLAEMHVERLKTIERVTGGVTREPNGTWIIASDHLDRVREFQRQRLRSSPFVIETLSSRPLEQQIDFDGATWLDRELTADTPEPVRDAGFGREVRLAKVKRSRWLVVEGLAHNPHDRFIYRANMLAILRQRELSRVAKQLSEELGLSYFDAHAGELVKGTLRRSTQLASGKYAIITNAREFTLVPWCSELEPHRGRQVVGVVRSSGISWRMGQERGGPSIS